MAATSLKRTTSKSDEDKGTKKVATESGFICTKLHSVLSESRNAIKFAHRSHPDDHLARLRLVDARLRRTPQKTAKRVFAMYVVMMGTFPSSKPAFCSEEDWNELVERYKDRTLFRFRYDHKTRVVTLIMPDVYDAYLLSIVTCGTALTKASTVKSRKSWWAKANLGEFGFMFNKKPPARQSRLYHLGLTDCEKSFIIPEYLLKEEVFNIALNFSTQDQNHVCLMNAFAHVFWNVLNQYVTGESVEILRSGEPYTHSSLIVTIAPFDEAVKIGCNNACQAK